MDKESKLNEIIILGVFDYLLVVCLMTHISTFLATKCSVACDCAAFRLFKISKVWNGSYYS